MSCSVNARSQLPDGRVDLGVQHSGYTNTGSDISGQRGNSARAESRKGQDTLRREFCLQHTLQVSEGSAQIAEQGAIVVQMVTA